MAKYKKEKDLKFGGDILVFDSIKETPAEKVFKFILGENNFQRDLNKEQELLDDLERQYKELNKKENNN